MTDTSTPPDQDIDAGIAALSPWGRRWLLTVTSLALLLVMGSMVALNAALPDIAVETAANQAQLTWIVDSYTSRWPACCCPPEPSAIATAGAARCCWAW